MLVTLSLISILSAIAVWGLRSYTASQDFKGTANNLVAALRNIAERSQAEGRTYCLRFDTANTWSSWRYSCQSGWTDGNLVSGKVTSGAAQGSVTFGNASFAAGVNAGSCPATLGCIYFYPRGTASDGSLQVQSAGRSSIDITVVGLTGRVYQN